MRKPLVNQSKILVNLYTHYGKGLINFETLYAKISPGEKHNTFFGLVQDFINITHKILIARLLVTTKNLQDSEKCFRKSKVKSQES